MTSSKIESPEKKSRLLGLAFLVQFATSFSGGVFLLPMATGVSGFAVSGDIRATLAVIARNAPLIQLVVFMELVTAAGVIFLGAMLYSSVRKQGEGLALTAFGLYVLEAALIAVKMLLIFALLAYSRQYIAAGSPASLEPMAGLLYEVMGYSSKMLNFVFCLGGMIYYALLVKAGTVERPLSLWGLSSVIGVFVGVTLGLFGMNAPIILYVPYIPFELVIGVWILVSGVKNETGNDSGK